MSCNCKEMKGFDLAMFKARAYEQKNKKQAAVFVVNEKTPSFTDLSNIDKVKGICCYFTTDGVEHELEGHDHQTEAKDIEVNEPEVVKKEAKKTPEKSIWIEPKTRKKRNNK